MTELYVRPSNLGRTSICGAWLGLASWLGLTGSTDNEAAAEGRRLHALVAQLLEWLLRTGSGAVTRYEEAEGIVYEWLGEEPVELEEGDERLLASCLMAVGEHLPYVTDYHIEHKVTIPGLPHPGTLDLVLFCSRGGRDYRVITDWKFYRAGLASTRVPWIQIAAYWLGLPVCDESTLGIVHLPWVGETYAHEFLPAHRPSVQATIRDAIQDSKDPAWWELFRPAPDACKFCPCLANGCPAAAEATDELRLEAQSAASTPSVPLEKSAELTRWAPVIEEQIAVAKARVKAAILTGTKVDGFVVSTEKGRRGIEDLIGCYKRLLELELLSPAQFVGLAKVAFGALVSEAARHVPDSIAKYKKDKRAFVELELEPYIARGLPVMKLKRTSS
jgi:hypothetical protein